MNMNALAGAQVGNLQFALNEGQPVNLSTSQLETNLQ